MAGGNYFFARYLFVIEKKYPIFASNILELKSLWEIIYVLIG